MSQTIISGINNIDALLSTYQWGNSNGNSVNLSYSFPTASSTWNSPYGTSDEPFSPYSLTYLNTTQQQYTRDILQQWSEVANITFSEVFEPDNVGDIRVTYSTIVDQQGFGGWAYYPPSTSVTSYVNGDIWLNHTYTDLSLGTYGYSTLLHELGHALGLKHPFESDSTNPAVLTGTEDSSQYTVMSYTNYDGAGYTEIGNTNTYNKTQTSSAMLYDMAAIQFLYGANTSTRTGDDTYTFSNSTSELKTIWDAGGNDTFDLSNQSLNMEVNLTAGSFSSIGVITHKLVGSFIQSTNEAAVDNIAIAFNVEIENAIGGSGNDTITGNSQANKLTGGAGNDSLNGGSGDDTAIYTGNKADYQIQTIGANLEITSTSTNEGVDTLTGIEKLQFADVLIDAYTLTPVVTEPTTASEVVTSPVEGNSNHINYFLLQIGQALSVDASVDYITRDGTALAGQDYVATSGTATITAGQTSTVIGVEIIADSISESDEIFLLAISNPQGALFPTGVTEITASRTIIDDDAASGDIINEIQIIGVDDSLPV